MTKAKEFVDANEEALRLGTKFAQNCAIPVAIPDQSLPQDLLNMYSTFYLALSVLSNDFVSSFPKNSGLNIISNPYSFHYFERAREMGYKLFHKSEKQQLELLDQLLSTRHRLSKLTGFRSFAERSLKQTLAGSPEFVDSFLCSSSDRIRSKYLT